MVSMLFNIGLKVGSRGEGYMVQPVLHCPNTVICNTFILDFKVNMFQMILSHCQRSNKCAKTVKLSHYIGSTDLWQQLASYLAITAISLTSFRLLQFSTSYKLHISEKSSECTYAKLYHILLHCIDIHMQNKKKKHTHTHTHTHINLLSS